MLATLSDRGSFALASDHGKAAAFPRQGVVKAVFDGDTVLLETGQKVRYLGIDAPETAHDEEASDCFADEARKANSELVLGKKIILGYEGRKVDHYGRLLAYVFLPDGTCINLRFVESGHALVYATEERFGLFNKFMEAQRKAIKDRLGLWACPVEPASIYFGNRRTFVLHRPQCDLGRETSRRNRVRFNDRWSAFNQGFRPCRVCKP